MKKDIEQQIEATRKKLIELEAVKKKQEDEVKQLGEDFTPSRINLIKIRDKIDSGLMGTDIYSFEEYEGTFVKIGNWEIILHERFGGSSGDGEEHYLIYEVRYSGQPHSFWKVPGYYSSYEGSELEWDNVYQVQPVTKTIIAWE
jgi:hypothetical protein